MAECPSNCLVLVASNSLRNEGQSFKAGEIRKAICPDCRAQREINSAIDRSIEVNQAPHRTSSTKNLQMVV